MKKWLDKTWAKVTFFCLLVLFTVLFAACLLGIIYLTAENVYLDGGKQLTEWADRYILSPSYTLSALYTLIRCRYLLIVLAVVFLGLWIWCLSFTLASAGHWKGHEGIHLTWFDRIPFEFWFLPAAFLAIAVNEHPYYYYNYGFLMIPAAVGCVILVYLFLAAFSAQCKAGTVIKDSLTVRILRLLRRGLRGLWYVIGNIPLVWKTALGVLLLFIIDVICVSNSWEEEFLFMLLAVNFLAGLFLIYLAVGMRKLQKQGQMLAAGNYGSQVDTKYLLWDFRRHGEDLNAIQQGLQKAVSLQMRAERMKTELITNVSHDIKTPLTSIVNYVDLLKKEKIDNPTAAGYIDVLDRQSQRLKKLTENLVEASKAATGNLPVALTDTDVNVLLSQVSGEYAQRLSAENLELILTLDEANPHILGDGQLLWRVLDNLLSNVCKYAQPGTRVYLSSEADESQVYIIVRNISNYPLNISADELTERFVRGDASRSTEGSGLGLSIAMSLTKIQNGEFGLSVDGDLFKVTLRFSRLQRS